MTNANNLASLAQTKAAAEVTGTRYCARGSHYAKAEGGATLKTRGPHGSTVRHWLCATCAAQRLAMRAKLREGAK